MIVGGKGINGRRLERQRQMEEEDNIIVKRVQEDVETSNNLINNIYIYIYIYIEREREREREKGGTE